MRALVLAGGLLLAGQMTPAPPMKMGLWEITSVTTINFPAGMVDSMKKVGMTSGVPFTNVEKACFTAEQWKKSLGVDSATKGCTYSKRDFSSKSFAVSMTCSFGGGVEMAMDTTATFSSPESMQGVAHTTTTYPASMMGGGKSVSDGTSKGKFISSDCGAIQPGKPVLSGGK